MKMKIVATILITAQVFLSFACAAEFDPEVKFDFRKKTITTPDIEMKVPKAWNFDRYSRRAWVAATPQSGPRDIFTENIAIVVDSEEQFVQDSHRKYLQITIRQLHNYVPKMQLISVEEDEDVFPDLKSTKVVYEHSGRCKNVLYIMSKNGKRYTFTFTTYKQDNPSKYIDKFTEILKNKTTIL